MSFSDLWYGLVGFSISTAVIYLVVTTQLTILAVTLYLHRYSAHRALDLHPALRHFFRFWLWLTTGMGTKIWTAIHRKHHALTDIEGDPHSPKVYGLAEILLKGTEYYRAAISPEVCEKYGKGTPDDWLERNIYGRRDIWGGVLLFMAIDLLLFGLVGIVLWGFAMAWIPFWGAGVINGIGHAWGYRNFETPDVSKNIVPWGVFIGGEELHNNHHTYPNSAKFSVKPWEVDIGWMWIRIFSALGLAKPRFTGPVAVKVSGRDTLDMDTMWAVLNDRFQVMANYADRVVAPIVAQEYRRVGEVSQRLLRRVSSMLCRDEARVNEAQRNKIEEIIESNQTLALIYQKRLELMEVWKKRTAGSEEMLVELRTWCVSAEESGIAVLREFVDELKSYTVPKLAPATS